MLHNAVYLRGKGENEEETINLKKLDKYLKKIIEENVLNIRIMENYNDNRDFMLWEIEGDFRSDATIIFDHDYFLERLEDEAKRIDKKIECYKDKIAVLRNENVFLKALLKV